jgi:hypothetical protein
MLSSYTNGHCRHEIQLEILKILLTSELCRTGRGHGTSTLYAEELVVLQWHEISISEADSSVDELSTVGFQ